MFNSFSLPVLLLIFAAAAAAVWVAGVYLSNATDILSSRWGLGEALGGLILLAVVTNLPEIAITVSGALRHDLGIAVGNLLGGIAVQTLVLVPLDIWGVGKPAPLTYRAASLSLVLEGILVLALLTLVVMGAQLPGTLVFARVPPVGLLIAFVWVVGLWLIGKSRTDLPWQDKGNAPGGQDAPRSQSHKKKEQDAKNKQKSTVRVVGVFALGALVTLGCGVVLENSGDAIAKHIGMTGVLFGATVLAASTSLPELSTGLASIKLGDYQLAVSDIFGGNAFLTVLFLLASVISGQPVLPHAQKSDIYLTGLGMLLTAVYVTGLIFRPKMQVARMGIDSLVVLVLYGLAMGGLFVIARG